MTELLFTGEQLGRLALQFLLAGAGTLSFAILFACPRRTLPYCGWWAQWGGWYTRLRSCSGWKPLQPRCWRSFR